MSPEAITLIKSAIDIRQGDGVADALCDYLAGTHTQVDIAIRLGVPKQVASRKLERAKTYALKLLTKSGLAEAA